MTVIDSHGKKYSAECINMLRFECNLLISHIADVRVCAFVSREHPETLHYDVSALTITDDAQVPDNNYNAMKQNFRLGQIYFQTIKHLLAPLLKDGLVNSLGNTEDNVQVDSCAKLVSMPILLAVGATKVAVRFNSVSNGSPC